MTSLLPGIEDVAQQDEGSSEATSGRRSNSREQYNDTTPSDDGTTGFRDWKSMFADDGEGKSYDNPSGYPGKDDGYESHPNGDGYRNEYPNGDTQYIDGNGNPSNDSDDGTCTDDSLPEEDGYNGQSTGEPDDDEPKEDPPKDDKPKEDPPKEDPPKEDDAGDDSTDNTPPDGCTPGTVVECGGDEEDYAPLPETIELGTVRSPTGSSQKGGEVDPAEDDGTGSITGIATDAEIVNLKDKLLGGDRLDGEGLHFGGGGPGAGDHGSQTSQNGGATDWGPDHTDPQGSGPEERNTQHELKPEANSGQQDDGNDQDSSGGTIKMVAVQNEATETLRNAIEENGGLKQDKAVDPDRLEKIHAKEAVPGAPSHATGDFADLIAATQKPFEFLQTHPTSPEFASNLLRAAQIDLGGPGIDPHLEVETFTAPAVAVEHHHTLAQPVFDLDFA